MAIRWPTTLPGLPIKDGFRHRPGDNLIVSPTQTGPGKTRPRQSFGHGETSATFVMDKAQVDTFLYFYEEITAWGSRWFYNLDLVSAFLQRSDRAFRIKGSPSITPYGCEYKVQVTLLVKRAPSYYQAQLFSNGEAGGFLLPDGDKWQDAGRTTPAVSSADPVMVWERSAGTVDGTSSSGNTPEIA